MPIINRAMDLSGQKDVYDITLPSQVSTGQSLLIVGPIPYPYIIDSIRLAAIGLSGAPTMRPLIARFIPTVGYTVIPCGFTSITLANYGTSGNVGASIFAAGSTLLVGLAGDVISLDMGGSNTAASQITGELILRKTQDIVSYNGI